MKSSEYFKNSSEAELMMSLSLGNREAFNEIYQRKWKELYNALFHALRDREIAAGMTMKVMVAFWKNRTRHLYPEIYPNLVKELQHELTIYYELPENHPDKVLAIMALAYLLLQPSQIKADPALFDCIEIWLETQPENRQNIFRLNVYDELTVEQIALQFHLTTEEVKGELHRLFLAFEAYLKNTKP